MVRQQQLSGIADRASLKDFSFFTVVRNPWTQEARPVGLVIDKDTANGPRVLERSMRSGHRATTASKVPIPDRPSSPFLAMRGAAGQLTTGNRSTMPYCFLGCQLRIARQANLKTICGRLEHLSEDLGGMHRAHIDQSKFP